MTRILTYPNPILRQKAESIETVDDNVRHLIETMTDAMYMDDGVGLAATQIGITKRLIVFDAGEGLQALINPEIIETGNESQAMEEGCLSLPGIRMEITRPTHVVIKGLDEQGNPVLMDAEGLKARILQHEIDHLDGVLIVDRASSIQRSLFKSRLKKLEKEFS